MTKFDHWLPETPPVIPQMSTEEIGWAVALAEGRVVAIGQRWVAYATKEFAIDAFEAMVDDGHDAHLLSTKDFLSS